MSNKNIDSLLRYIMNIKDNYKQIKDNYQHIEKESDIFLNNQSYLKIIINYISNTFNSNCKSIEEFYEKIIIKQHNKSIKGIYLKECENESMEKFVIDLILDKTKKLPISQNVLFANKETSSEEIQVFLFRAIFCNYNTLFVIEIYNSFSEYQLNELIYFLDSILSYKIQKYNEDTGKKVNKKDTSIYLESCLVFIYNKDNINISPFLKEIKKYELKFIKNNDIKENKEKLLSKLGNITIITSDLCGLGKSKMIRKLIHDSNKKYIYFSLEGVLSKNVIFDKIKNLIENLKIKNSEELAIHIDLSQSYETETLNEFFFSFLITKFYKKNDDIIYIPKDILIYIEIPNGFFDYFSAFPILKIFKRKNISFEAMPKFDFSKDILDIFNNTLKINSNEQLLSFVNKYIGLKKYSYYQIIIFINLFINQFKKYKSIENNEEILKDFAKFTYYFTHNLFVKTILEKDKDENYYENLIDLLFHFHNKDLCCSEFPDPLIILKKDKNIKISDIRKFSLNYNNNNNDNYYLTQFQELFDIPIDVNKISKNNNDFIITNDIFRKMVLLSYRIKANIPIIIMGESGLGKKSMIIKLNELLNFGKENLHIIHINKIISNEEIYEIIKTKNEIAKDHKDKELWLYFDNIYENNYYLNLPIIKEIFTNKTFNGKDISGNIRLIGSCYPYKKRKISKLNYGLDLHKNKIVHLVQPPPQSLMYYIFNYETSEDYEKKYIYNKIEKLFSDKEKDLKDITTEIILICQKYIRENLDIYSFSFKEFNIFSKLIRFFDEYYEKKNMCENKINNKRNNKLKSIICSIYLSYLSYFKTCPQTKYCFEVLLGKKLFKLVNNIEIEDQDKEFVKYIYNEDLRNEIFSDFIKLEEDYLINQMELENGIGKTSLLKENIFLLFITIITRIPLIMIGNTGSSKSLSLQLIIKSMKGEYSKNKFFRQFPRVLETYFKCSISTKPEDIENIFIQANKKLDIYKNLPISLVTFDNLGLLENFILGIINSKVENYCKNNNLSFVGISDYSLDNASIKESLFYFLNIPENKFDEIMDASSSIVESIFPKMKNDEIFQILSRTYLEYKNILKKIKELIVYQNHKKNQGENYSFEDFKKSEKLKDLMREEPQIRIDFHSDIDFYYLIKGIANDFLEIYHKKNADSEKISKIVKHIERNFGGIDYNIDLDLKSLNDNEYGTIKRIMENRNKKLNSVDLFKILFNFECEKNNSYISINIGKIDLIKCIYDNIRDINSRFLLVETTKSLEILFYQIIRLQNPNAKILLFDESPFNEDKNNKDYIITELNRICNEINEEKIIIINNLNQIHSFLYELYKRNNQIINGEKYIRIFLNNINEQLVMVNRKIRIILLVDETFINNCHLTFLNRFEKIKISLVDLLDDEIKKRTDEFNLSNNLINNINYSLKDLLINCQIEKIEELFFFYRNKLKIENDNYEEIHEPVIFEDIKNIVIDKIYKILPQDIIALLPDDNFLKRKYYEIKDEYNFNDYLIKLRNKNIKISIIYTFTTISSQVSVIEDEFNIRVSEIKNLKELKDLIEKIKKKNITDFICFHFEPLNSYSIKFISNFILSNFRYDNYKYIFIMHINRNFIEINNKITIFTLSDINPDVYQIFIDNLDGNNNIKLNDLINQRINNLLEQYKDEQNFENNLEKFMGKKKEKNNLYNEIKNNLRIKDIIQKILNDNFINNNTIDLISCIIKYIKDNVFIDTNKLKTGISKYLCKVESQNGKKSIGFFCRIPFPDNINLLNLLLIKNNEINQNSLEKDKILKIKPFESDKYININLSNRIYYISQQDDICFIEIKKEEYNDDFIDLNNKIKDNIFSINNENLNNLLEKIYTMRYIENILYISFGISKNIFNENNNFIVFNKDNELENNLFPMIDINNNELIGIHVDNKNNVLDLQCLIKNFIEIKYYIENALNKFNTEKEHENIGEGGFGKVYLIEYKNKKYALKQIPLAKFKDESKKYLDNETKILSMFNSEFIIKYYQSYQEGEFYNIIMEYAGRSNLKTIIENYSNDEILIEENKIIN